MAAQEWLTAVLGAEARATNGDDIDEDGIATCRTKADAPEIDGNLFIDADTEGLSVGDLVRVEVDEAGEYDLWGARLR